MNIIAKTGLWIYNFLISIILSIIFIFTVLVENFLEILTGSKITSLLSLNINLISQISKINSSLNFDEIFAVNDYKSFTSDSGVLYKNFLSVFILIIFLPIFFVTVLLFAILNALINSEKISNFLQNLNRESIKLLLKLTGYKTEGNFYYSNLNIFYFLIISIPLYYVLSRPAFYGNPILSSFLGGNIGYILGNVLGAVLMGLYFIYIFPHFFGPIFKESKKSFLEDIGLKKLTPAEILISLFVIVVFISILASTYKSFVPSANETYDFAKIIPYLSFALIAGILEEVYFRGIVLNFLLNNSKNKRVAIPIVLSALTFGSAHLVNILYGLPINNLMFQIYIAFIFGLLIGIIYYKTKSLWPGIIIHTLIDAYSFGFNFTYSGPVISNLNLIMIEFVGWTIAIGSMILFFVLIIVLMNSVSKPNVI